MVDFTIALAGMNIGINARFDEIKTMCADYITDAQPDFVLTSSPEAISFEYRKAQREAEVENLPIMVYPQPYMETLAIYRMIAERMMDYNTILFYDRCVYSTNQGYNYDFPLIFIGCTGLTVSAANRCRFISHRFFLPLVKAEKIWHIQNR